MSRWVAQVSWKGEVIIKDVGSIPEMQPLLPDGKFHVYGGTLHVSGNMAVSGTGDNDRVKRAMAKAADALRGLVRKHSIQVWSVEGVIDIEETTNGT